MWEMQDYTYKKQASKDDEQEVKTVKALKKGTVTDLLKEFPADIISF